MFKKYTHLLFHKHLIAPLVVALAAGAWIAFLAIPHSFDTSGLSIQIDAGQTTARYESPEITATEFNAVFVRLTEAGEGRSDMQVRFFAKNDGWSDWRPMSWDEELADGSGPDTSFLDSFTTPDELRTGTAMSVPSTRYQFRIDLVGQPGFQVSEIQIEARDTRQRSFFRFFNHLIPAAVGQITDLGIIDRASWGADPKHLFWYPGRAGSTTPTAEGEQVTSARGRLCAEWQRSYPEDFTKDGRVIAEDLSGNQLFWEREYSPQVKKIVLHHTASVDRDVNGDGVFDEKDAAAIVRAIYFRHAVFNNWGDVGYHYLIDPFGNIYEGRSGGERVVGAHVYCANTQTIGVALIGHFNEERPTEAAIEAASKLLGELSNIYSVDLVATEEWHGRLTPGLVGHRDYGYTACPGDNLYTRLPEIAQRAMNYALITRPSDKDYDYQIEASNSPIQLVPLARDQISFTLKNTGRKAWPTGTSFTLSRSDLRAAATGAALNTNRELILKLDRALPAGETLQLTLPIVAGLTEGRYRFGITPDFVEEKGSTLFAVAHVGTPHLDYEVVSAKHPPRPFSQGESAEAWVELRNKSNFTWKASGNQRAYLAAVNPENRVSSFTNSNIMGYLERDVAPGETGKFVMNLTAAPRNQRYIEHFAPAIDGFGMLPDYGMYFDILVREPRFSAAIVDRSRGADLRFFPNETKTLFVELQNTSQLVWDPAHFSLLPVKTRSVTLSQPTGRINREVAPGETVRIPIEVTAPPRGGKAVLSLRPSWSNGQSRVDSPIDFAIDIVQPELTAALTDVAIDGTRVRVSYQNTGSFVWKNTGTQQVKLGTTAPQDRRSAIYTASWQAPTRPAMMQESVVQPGETATFVFDTQLPEKTEIEVFAPVMETVGWMNQSPLRLRATPSGIEFIGTIASSVSAPSVGSRTAAAVVDESREAVASQSYQAVTVARMGERGPDIRIRLGFQSDTVVIGGGDFVLKNMNNDTIFRGSVVDFSLSKMKNGQFYRVEPVGTTILEISNWNHAPGWTDKINDNKYRGSLIIHRIAGKLVVVNELPLEDYLRGVAEPLPTDPDEKAKALAMMARSYALYYVDPAHRKYPGQPYDGSDSPAEFQKYLGYNYELRGNMPKFVEETRGKILTLDGKVVKTPYFTSSSGRTKTPAEARWNAEEFKFTVSVPDPWSCGLDSKAIGTQFSCPEKAAGHGVGASGMGMTGLAKEGKTAAEIIAYFYRGLAITQEY